MSELVPLKLYNISTIKDPNRVRAVIEEAVEVLKINCVNADFTKDEVREQYTEHLKLVRNYLTILEVMLNDG